ncbi:MAG: TonB-dependent receptor [Bacteroidales bacterium]|nr:TonB-dependent receptor [Candidatus Cacconaster scatequi]
MKQKLFALLATVLVFAAGVNAQNVKVSGTVSDNVGPVAGASILVKGTTEGTITDVDGKYSISVPANATLVVSFIGYQTEEVAVGGRSVVNVLLKEDSELLAESVVLGYGVATKKKDLSASVGIVASPEKLAAHPVTSTQAMLQGQIPGVTITSDGGSPDSTPNIVIRGQGSKNGDSVLWVVDGIPGAPINSLNDIESIVVLKDAASAAIYGATSGAGGVVLVTTKKAKEGVHVEYDGLVGVRQATNVIQSLNAQEQIEMNKRSAAAAGQALNSGWDPQVNPYIAETRTDWLKEIFRTALYHRHNVVLNAGTEKFKNRLSFNAESNDGVIYNTYKKTMGINYRGEFQVNKYIKFTEDLSWRQGDSRGTDTNSGYSGTIFRALGMPQSASRYFWDGTGYGGTANEDPEYVAKYGQFAEIHGDVVNPFRGLDSQSIYNRWNSLFTTTGLELANIVKGLKFNSRFTFYVDNGYNKTFTPKITEVGKKEDKNSLSYSTYRNQGWKTENTLTYDRTFGKHSVGALLSTTADKSEGRGFSVSGAGFVDEAAGFQYMQYADLTTLAASDTKLNPDANVAFIGRLSYSFDDRYFVTASWRRDIAARLPVAHNYGDFPAVTGAWKISSEPFFQKSDAVTLLKLRASWGRIGNLGSIGVNYKSALLSSGAWNGQSVMYGLSDDGKGITCGTFYFLGSSVNPALTWETSEQLDFGLDANFFGDRLTTSFDFYNKRTYNLIQSMTSGWPQTMGLSSMLVNQGEVKNRGVEMQIGWEDKVGNWTYFVNANAAYNKNWVSDIGVLNADGSKGVWSGGGSYTGLGDIYQTAEGMPIQSYYLINCLGIFQNWEDVYDHQKDGKLIQPNAQPGDLKFEDFNGDGKIDSNDRQYWGNSVPDWTYAFNAGFTWKGLSLSVMLQGVQGAQAAYMGKFSLYNDGDKNFNRSKDILNAWTPENPTSNIPRLTKDDANNNFKTLSTYYLEDASYLRIKNVTLSYDFTKLLRKAAHFNERNSSIMVYFSGENLFTFTKYSGMDPECNGWDGLKYPVNRILSFGLKFTY